MLTQTSTPETFSTALEKLRLMNTTDLKYLFKKLTRKDDIFPNLYNSIKDKNKIIVQNSIDECYSEIFNRNNNTRLYFYEHVHSTNIDFFIKNLYDDEIIISFNFAFFDRARDEYLNDTHMTYSNYLTGIDTITILKDEDFNLTEYINKKHKIDKNETKIQYTDFFVRVEEIKYKIHEFSPLNYKLKTINNIDFVYAYSKFFTMNNDIYPYDMTDLIEHSKTLNVYLYLCRNGLRDEINNLTINNNYLEVMPNDSNGNAVLDRKNSFLHKEPDNKLKT